MAHILRYQKWLQPGDQLEEDVFQRQLTEATMDLLRGGKVPLSQTEETQSQSQETRSSFCCLYKKAALTSSGTGGSLNKARHRPRRWDVPYTLSRKLASSEASLAGQGTSTNCGCATLADSDTLTSENSDHVILLGSDATTSQKSDHVILPGSDAATSQKSDHVRLSGSDATTSQNSDHVILPVITSQGRVAITPTDDNTAKSRSSGDPMSSNDDTKAAEDKGLATLPTRETESTENNGLVPQPMNTETGTAAVKSGTKVQIHGEVEVAEEANRTGCKGALTPISPEGNCSSSDDTSDELGRCFRHAYMRSLLTYSITD